MPFSDAQNRKLAAALRRQHVKERQADGKTLRYLEGWHVVAEANRIFGFDGWDRETVSSQCVAQRHADARSVASYITRVRVSVRAGATVVVREGLGSGEATAPTSGQAHERASKAAETDATKRALSTFGNPFGLSLYRDKPALRPRDKEEMKRRPSGPASLTARGEMRPAQGLARIDKSELTLAEPRRVRDEEHRRYVARQPCVVCGRTPSQAHHLRFAQPRALARKVSDEFTVPLCALHHQELHLRGDERLWWNDKRIDPLPIAEDYWRASRTVGTQAAE